MATIVGFDASAFQSYVIHTDTTTDSELTLLKQFVVNTGKGTEQDLEGLDVEEIREQFNCDNLSLIAVFNENVNNILS